MSLFLCNIVPQQFVQYYNVSQASMLFCKRVLNLGYFTKIISSPPITVADDIKDRVNEVGVIYVQSRLFKHSNIGRYLNALNETFTILKKCRGERNIWFYNLNNQNLLLFFTLRFFTSKRVFVLLADFTPPLRFFSISTILEKMIMSSNGILALSGRISIKNTNSASIAGIVEKLNIQSSSKDLINRKDFFFSGFLGEVTGIELALDFFSKEKSLNLFITGRGPYEQKVRKYAEQYHNIHYFGFLEYNEYLKVLNEIDICLNLRNPNLPENKNNFPSKVLEYFTYSKIIISTISYPELKDLIYFKADYSSNSLTQITQIIQECTEGELSYYRSHSDILKREFSEEAWCNAFAEIETFKN